jgi:hypothetical protein
MSLAHGRTPGDAPTPIHYIYPQGMKIVEKPVFPFLHKGIYHGITPTKDQVIGD